MNPILIQIDKLLISRVCKKQLIPDPKIIFFFLVKRFSSELVINLESSSQNNQNTQKSDDESSVYKTKIERFVKSYSTNLEDLKPQDLVDKETDNLEQVKRRPTTIKTQSVKSIAKLFEKNNLLQTQPIIKVDEHATPILNTPKRSNLFIKDRINTKKLSNYSRHLKILDSTSTEEDVLNISANDKIQKNDDDTPKSLDEEPLIDGSFVSKLHNEGNDCEFEKPINLRLDTNRLFNSKFSDNNISQGINCNYNYNDDRLNRYKHDEEQSKAIENGMQISKCKIARLDIDSKITPNVEVSIPNKSIDDTNTQSNLFIRIKQFFNIEFFS